MLSSTTRQPMSAILRHLPSIDLLLNRDGLQSLITQAGRETVRDHLRDVLETFRDELRTSDPASFKNNGDDPGEKLAQEIEQRLHQKFSQRQRMATQRVINATGVIIHTNLGRAPLSQSAIEAIRDVAAGYCNLEYDLDAGRRGKRGTGLTATLKELFACEAAAVVNNCAAAVLLVLNTLAEGGEVIVSRGELIEIGGSFRIPDVIAKSGARIREVGTTNRTRLADYEKAINENTHVILRAHPSNYRITGFTEKPRLSELTALAEKYNLPLFEDLGSGSLMDLTAFGIADEPTVAESVRSGASVIAFSGDKLLGGPQAGIILGKSEFIDRVKSNPLMRALRVDKLTYAALEATINAYARNADAQKIPVVSALHTSPEAIRQRARRFVRRAGKLHANLQWKVTPGNSVIGGGCAPETTIPSHLITLTSTRHSAAQLEAHFRQHHLPIITRIVADAVVIDLRTVQPAEEKFILEAAQSLRLPAQL